MTVVASAAETPPGAPTREGEGEGMVHGLPSGARGRGVGGSTEGTGGTGGASVYSVLRGAGRYLSAERALT